MRKSGINQVFLDGRIGCRHFGQKTIAWLILEVVNCTVTGVWSDADYMGVVIQQKQFSLRFLLTLRGHAITSMERLCL